MSEMVTASRPSILEAAHNLIERQQTFQLAGSLGRAAHMGVAVFDETRPDGTRRDIDGYRFGDRSEEMLGWAQGVRVDTGFEKWIKWESDRAWLVFPWDESVSVEIPYAEDVFAPQEIALGDFVLRVANPQTLGKINTMMHTQRPKDKNSARVYNQYLTEYLATKSSAEILDSAMLQPFEDFRSAVAERRGYTGAFQVGAVYRAVVPKRIRQNEYVMGAVRKVGDKLKSI